MALGLKNEEERAAAQEGKVCVFNGWFDLGRRVTLRKKRTMANKETVLNRNSYKNGHSS